MSFVHSLSLSSICIFHIKIESHILHGCKCIAFDFVVVDAFKWDSLFLRFFFLISTSFETTKIRSFIFCRKFSCLLFYWNINSLCVCKHESQKYNLKPWKVLYELVLFQCDQTLCDSFKHPVAYQYQPSIARSISLNMIQNTQKLKWKEKDWLKTKNRRNNQFPLHECHVPLWLCLFHAVFTVNFYVVVN